MVSTCKKPGEEGKTPLWMSRDLLVELKDKKEIHRQWKQRHDDGALSLQFALS